MIGILINGLFLYRKPFSYLNVGGIYVIELFTAFMLLSIIFRINKIKLRRDLVSLFIALCLFVFYGLFVSLGTSFSPKLIIVYLYYGYLIIYILYSSLLRRSYRDALTRNINLLFTNPLLWIVVTLALEPFFGKAVAPGQTLVYGVGLAYSLDFKGSHKKKVYYLVSTLGASLYLMERASFLNGVLVFLVFSFIKGNLDIKKILYFGFRLVFGVICLAFFAPILFDLVFPGVFTRFDLNPTSLLNFFISIFGGRWGVEGSDMIGTRAHRLSMWVELLKLIHSDWRYSLFGFGFEKEIGEYVGIAFRAPHNGYITLLFRLGYIGLSMFLVIIIMILSQLKKLVHMHPIFLMVFLGFLVDALTGTAFDSPFTLGLVFSIIGLGLIYDVKLVSRSQ